MTLIFVELDLDKVKMNQHADCLYSSKDDVYTHTHTHIHTLKLVGYSIWTKWPENMRKI